MIVTQRASTDGFCRRGSRQRASLAGFALTVLIWLFLHVQRILQKGLEAAAELEATQARLEQITQVCLAAEASAASVYG